MRGWRGRRVDALLDHPRSRFAASKCARRPWAPGIDPLPPDPSGIVIGPALQGRRAELRRRVVRRDGLVVGYGWLRGVRLVGERAGELAARADAELAENLPQVVGDGGRADEQLLSDLRVGGASAGQAGDQRLLRGQDVGSPGGAFERLRTGGAQLDPGPFGERLHAEAAEQLVGAAQ